MGSTKWLTIFFFIIEYAWYILNHYFYKICTDFYIQFFNMIALALIIFTHSVVILIKERLDF